MKASLSPYRGLPLKSSSGADTEANEDFLLQASRVVLYFGLFASSLLVFRLGTFSLGDGLIVLSLVLAVFSLDKRKQMVDVYTFFASLLVLIGGCLASAMALDPTDSLQVLGRVLFLAVVLPWLAMTVLPKRKHLVDAAYALALGAALCGAGTLIQFLVGPDAIPGTGVTNAGRFPGFTAHVSDTGGVTALAVVFAFAIAGTDIERGRRPLTFLLFGGGGIGLILSGSVSGMLAAGIACAIIFFLRKLSLRRLLTLTVAAAIAFYGSTAVLSKTTTALNPLERTYQVFGLTGSRESLNTTDSRWDTIQAGLEGFMSQPLTGAGLDALSSQIVDTFGVHNFPVAALYQGGIFFAAGLFAVIVRAFKGLEIKNDTLAVAIFGMATAALIFAQTAPSLYNRYFWVPLALLVVTKLIPGPSLQPLGTEQPRVPLSRASKRRRARGFLHRNRRSTPYPVDVRPRRTPLTGARPARSMGVPR